MSELYQRYSDEVNRVRREIPERELSLWWPLWKALLDLAGPEVKDAEILARAMTAWGPVVVTAGLVRGLAVELAGPQQAKGELR